jgi:hypothetical protein
MMIGEWWIQKDVEGSGRCLILRYYPGICLERQRKTTKVLSQDSRYPDRVLNPGHLEYEAVLTHSTTTFSVSINMIHPLQISSFLYIFKTSVRFCNNTFLRLNEQNKNQVESNSRFGQPFTVSQLQCYKLPKDLRPDWKKKSLNCWPDKKNREDKKWVDSRL